MSAVDAWIASDADRADRERLAFEALVDRLVGDVAGGIAVLRYDRVGQPGVPGLTDDMCRERAASIVQSLIVNFRVTSLDDEEGGR